MFKPKTTISAVFASPKRGIERDGRLENSSGEWDVCSEGVFDTPSGHLPLP
jgi:hypothetical protein